MKQIAQILKSSQRHWVGDGFYVSSVFSYSTPGLQLSPFLLLDYAAPHEFPADGKRRGVGAHPHKGFETVTIAYQGEVQHRDSSGGGGVIGAGDVQWMTAGAGLMHEEFHSEQFARNGGTFEMVQLWVNLPAKFKNEAPHYQTIPSDKIPVDELPNGAGQLRVIAGQFDGAHGPAKTYSPVDLWDISLRGGAPVTLPATEGDTCLLLVMSGRAKVSGSDLEVGDLAVFDPAGTEFPIEASEPAHALYLAGEPINEPVVGQGPFVMNSQEEIVEAFEMFRSGKFGNLN